MKKYLCLSLCLSVMASACSLGVMARINKENAKKGTETELDDATVTITLTKKEVLEACLPQINGLLITKYGRGGRLNFFLRRNTQHDGTPEAPVVVLYTNAGMPLEFAARTTSGLGPTVADAMANLKEMAASKVIQNQFVEREKVEGVAPEGYRIHISAEATSEAIPFALPRNAPVSPSEKLVIYNPESLAAAAVNSPEVIADPVPAGDRWAGWYDCDVDKTTQIVTAWFTEAHTQA